MSQGAIVDTIARRSAAQLLDVDPRLPDQIEQALTDDPLARPAERIIDPISLGALIVSIASLGWTVYHDIKKDRTTAGLDQVGKVQRLAEQLHQAGLEIRPVPPDITPERRARIISVIAAEVVGFDPS
jgi:hypothetical protein